jgi:hypothetical protein
VLRSACPLWWGRLRCDGRTLYQLLGLKGSIAAYRTDSAGSLTELQKTTGLLPMTHLVGLVSVDR